MALLHWKFRSETLGIAASADIILPQAAVESGKKLPVLYLLHGLSDDHSGSDAPPSSATPSRWDWP